MGSAIAAYTYGKVDGCRTLRTHPPHAPQFAQYGSCVPGVDDLTTLVVRGIVGSYGTTRAYMFPIMSNSMGGFPGAGTYCYFSTSSCSQVGYRLDVRISQICACGMPPSPPPPPNPPPSPSPPPPGVLVCLVVVVYGRAKSRANMDPRW